MTNPANAHVGFYEGLVQIHGSLRTQLNHLLQMDDRVPVAEVAALAMQLTGFLNGHHSVEEQYLFPAIRKDAPLRSVDVAFLDLRDREHHAIHLAGDAIQSSVRRIGAADGRAELRKQAEELQSLLLPHLTEEERGLAPKYLVELISLESLVQMNESLAVARAAWAKSHE